LSVFILIHLYIMAVWGLPGSTFRYIFSQPIAGYVIASGLWHSWDMFSPDPLAVNFNVEAQILYQDGSTKIWEFPRMEKLGIWERFQKERYRKWRERVRLDAYGMAWDDTARFIARLNDTWANHPVRVTLVRHWQPIPSPATVPGKSKFKRYQPITEDPNFKFNFRFKFYEVRPEDL